MRKVGLTEMSRTAEFFLAFGVGFVIGIFFASVVILKDASFDSTWHRQAVESGAGEYNSKTGKFQFKKPVELERQKMEL